MPICNMKYYLSFLFVALLFSCNTKRQNADDPLVYAEANDPELEQAKNDALAKLDYFINSFNAHPNDSTRFYSVKADFVEDETHEHMWIELSYIEGDQFKGVLGNDPENLTHLQMGDTITISRKDIEDWIITDDNSEDFEGGFSIKVFQKRGEF
jgi:uncharacterized protein YegJ (DUF2314 family)